MATILERTDLKHKSFIWGGFNKCFERKGDSMDKFKKISLCNNFFLKYFTIILKSIRSNTVKLYMYIWHVNVHMLVQAIWMCMCMYVHMYGMCLYRTHLCWCHVGKVKPARPKLDWWFPSPNSLLFLWLPSPWMASLPYQQAPGILDTATVCSPVTSSRSFCVWPPPLWVSSSAYPSPCSPHSDCLSRFASDFPALDGFPAHTHRCFSSKIWSCHSSLKQPFSDSTFSKG